MSNDDWEAKYWQQRAQQIQRAKTNPESLPHYEPAHVTQDKQRTLRGNDGGWQDIDPVTAMYTNAHGMASRGMGPQVQTVMLKPGTVYYKAVDASGFGNTMPLVRKCGPYYENGVNREFEMMQECRCYVIDNLNTVDLSNIDPKRLVQLVQVRAPFVGTILVERGAVISPSNRGPQVLKG